MRAAVRLRVRLVAQQDVAQKDGPQKADSAFGEAFLDDFAPAQAAAVRRMPAALTLRAEEMVALHASCVTRPHVVGPDGSLRTRYGALFDLWIRADEIVGARVERRYPEGRLIQPRDDGSLELIVANQTTVAVEPAAPVRYARPLGREGRARIVRFQSDDPKA